MFYGQRARPENTRRWLMLALAGGALCSAPLALAVDWVQVLVLRLLLGLLAGGAMSLAYAYGARLAPAERSGLTLSLLSSFGQLGGAIAPMLAGLIGVYSLAAVFVVNAGAYLVALVTAAVFARSQPPGRAAAASTPKRREP